MGRRKRQSYTQMESSAPKESEVPVFEWPTAIYARLSVENSKKDDEGESIEGQIEICRDYVEEHPYLSLADTYVDNGWTGVNTDRPAFQRLLSDIQNGSIKALVIKDFSRFSRDYIEAGNLLENIFPAMGVRFISVADRYDSFETDGSAQSLLIPLKNLINSFYSKDISRKVSTAVHARQMAAAHIPSMIPYGYRKSTTQEYRFEPDPETAANVTRIFQMRVDGVPINRIATTLQEEGIPSPGKLRYLRGQTKDPRYADARWSPAVIKQTLRNPTYLGHLVFGRMPTALYLGKPDYKYEPDESKWRILYNMHEPLTTQEIFDRCKAMQEASTRKWQEEAEKKHENNEKNKPLFLDLVYCGDCGSRMAYHRNNWNPELFTGRYDCPRYHRQKCAGTHAIKQETLKEIVWQAIKVQLDIFLDCGKVLELLADGTSTTALEECRKEILRISLQMKDRQDKRERLYEDFTDGLLTPEDYTYMKKRYDDEYREFSAKLNAEQTRQAKLKKSLSGRNSWAVHMRKFTKVTELSEEMLKELIEKILVYQDAEKRLRVEVCFKYGADRDMLLAAKEELIGGENQ